MKRRSHPPRLPPPIPGSFGFRALTSGVHRLAFPRPSLSPTLTRAQETAPEFWGVCLRGGNPAGSEDCGCRSVAATPRPLSLLGKATMNSVAGNKERLAVSSTTRGKKYAVSRTGTRRRRTPTPLPDTPGPPSVAAPVRLGRGRIRAGVWSAGQGDADTRALEVCMCRRESGFGCPHPRRPWDYY